MTGVTEPFGLGCHHPLMWGSSSRAGASARRRSPCFQGGWSAAPTAPVLRRPAWGGVAAWALLALLLSGPAGGGDELFDALPPTTNIHHSGRHCELCHDPVPEGNDDLNLRFVHDDQATCRCHFGQTSSYPHPVEIEPSQAMLDRIPEAFPLSEGKVTCATCHDVGEQCRIRPRGRGFLRGAPYASAKEMCFRCHDSSHYERRDPHQQVDLNGKLIEETCYYCHVDVPNVETDEFKDLSFVTDVEALCRRCHRHQRHPGGVEHHVRPSPKLAERIEQMEAEHATLMPMTRGGQITCVTCHNPHEAGVIPAHRPSARGAGSPGRHRAPNLCEECHLK